MNRACTLASTLPLLVLSLCLTVPAPVSADTTPPALLTLTEDTPDTEAVPKEVFAEPGYRYLNRLIFRYEAVHFNLDSSVLLPAGQCALRRKVRWLNKHPEATVIVEGHCDERGSKEYNLKLGARRALAARAFLIEEGISPGRIRIVSRGKAHPEVKGRDERAWSRNRRAEFIPR